MCACCCFYILVQYHTLQITLLRACDATHEVRQLLHRGKQAWTRARTSAWIHTLTRRLSAVLALPGFAQAPVSHSTLEEHQQGAC